MDQHELHNALIQAAKRGDTEGVKVAIKAGADINAQNGAPVGLAARNDYVDTVEWLIAAGANVRLNDDYAICCAASQGFTEIVEILASAGADMNALKRNPH